MTTFKIIISAPDGKEIKTTLECVSEFRSDYAVRLVETRIRHHGDGQYTIQAIEGSNNPDVHFIGVKNGRVVFGS